MAHNYSFRLVVSKFKREQELFIVSKSYAKMQSNCLNLIVEVQMVDYFLLDLYNKINFHLYNMSIYYWFVIKNIYFAQYLYQ